MKQRTLRRGDVSRSTRHGNLSYRFVDEFLDAPRSTAALSKLIAKWRRRTTAPSLSWSAPAISESPALRHQQTNKGSSQPLGLAQRPFPIRWTLGRGSCMTSKNHY